VPKFFIKTYGCQMNERDSEQVAHSLVARGYERVDSEVDADVVLLNTCSVRDMAEQKALGKMGMLGRIRKNRPETVFGSARKNSIAWPSTSMIWLRESVLL